MEDDCSAAFTTQASTKVRLVYLCMSAHLFLVLTTFMTLTVQVYKSIGSKISGQILEVRTFFFNCIC